MLAKRYGASHVFILVAYVLLVRATVEAQTGRVSLQGDVSETVVLSVPPNFGHDNIEMEVISSTTVQMTLSSSYASASPVIEVPLIVRSNSGFKISAFFESEMVTLAQLSVTDVHPTGELVSSQAINALRGMRRSSDKDTSQSLHVLSGPRISLGGTLESPNNALQITLLIRLQPHSPRGWVVHLSFVGTPE